MLKRLSLTNIVPLHYYYQKKGLGLVVKSLSSMYTSVVSQSPAPQNKEKQKDSQR